MIWRGLLIRPKQVYPQRLHIDLLPAQKSQRILLQASLCALKRRSTRQVVLGPPFLVPPEDLTGQRCQVGLSSVRQRGCRRRLPGWIPSSSIENLHPLQAATANLFLHPVLIPYLRNTTSHPLLPISPVGLLHLEMWKLARLTRLPSYQLQKGQYSRSHRLGPVTAG